MTTRHPTPETPPLSFCNQSAPERISFCNSYPRLLHFALPSTPSVEEQRFVHSWRLFNPRWHIVVWSVDHDSASILRQHGGLFVPPRLLCVQSIDAAVERLRPLCCYRHGATGTRLSTATLHHEELELPVQWLAAVEADASLLWMFEQGEWLRCVVLRDFAESVMVRLSGDDGEGAQEEGGERTRWSAGWEMVAGLMMALGWKIVVA